MGNPARWVAVVLWCAAFLSIVTGPAASAEAAGGGGAWIGWCAEAGGPLRPSRPVYQPRGDRRWLTLGTGAPAQGCRGRAVPVDMGHVVWFGPLPAMAGSFGQGLTLQGLAGSAGFDVSDIQPVVEPAGSRQAEHRPMPLAVDILPMLDIRPFGDEERGGVDRRADRVSLTCRPGEKPAGFLFRHPGRTLPASTGLSVRVRVGTDGRGWLLGFSDAGRQRREDPLLLGSLEEAVTERPLPDLPRDGPDFSVTVTCPPAGGTLDVSAIELAPRAPARTTETAAWMWRPSAWREASADLFERLARHKAGVVYITVPLGDGAVEQADGLGDFIAAAAARGIAVWAVFGDPHAVLPSERPRFERWARLYAAYNAASPPGRRLAGLQLDIEPYLLPGYSQDAPAWDAAYVETVNAIATAAAGLPVEVAVPVWFGSSLRLGRILDRLAPEIGSIAVMDYRTDTGRIVDGALPFLAWGAEKRRGVRIAVEFGPLPDEEIRIYRPADTGDGELWRVPLDGGDALVLLDRPARNPAGPALSFIGGSIAPGRALTFHGDWDRAPELLRALEAEMKPWPSFLGMAIHGMD